MYVLMKIGRYAGEIRDVAAEQAHALVARGHASLPAEPKIVAEDAAKPEADDNPAKPKRRK